MSRQVGTVSCIGQWIAISGDGSVFSLDGIPVLSTSAVGLARMVTENLSFVFCEKRLMKRGSGVMTYKVEETGETIFFEKITMGKMPRLVGLLGAVLN